MYREEVICITEKNDNKTLFYTDVDELLIINILVKFSKRYGLINKMNIQTENSLNIYLHHLTQRFGMIMSIDYIK